MKVLYLCGVFAEENYKEVMDHAIGNVEFSANTFQRKMIYGLEENNLDFEVISAPFIGSYPNGSDIKYFRGFENNSSGYRFVEFNNLWGYRNISRAKSIKKALQHFIADQDDEKMIIVYAAHTPFMEAAAYAKKKDPRIKICLVVPDLIQYMNLNDRISLIYKVCKKYDIWKFNRLNRMVDSYMLLTETMTEMLDTDGKPCVIAEGLVTDEELEDCAKFRRNVEKDLNHKTIVYTGKLNINFGIIDLVDAFMHLNDDKLRLILCGSGDAEEYVKEASYNDQRIKYMGQVTPQEARLWMFKADILVNPRKNEGEYTKYSFPSKTIEYLLTGNKVLAYYLDGMPQDYVKYLYVIEDKFDSYEDIVNVIKQALLQPERVYSFEGYITKLNNQKVIKQLLESCCFVSCG